MVPSIQVAHLLVNCVLIGSLAELLFSFHMLINGYCLDFKSPLQYLTLTWFSTKNEVM
jgi:hypothetical protein